MKNVNRFSFIRTTIVGGLIFLVPIIVLIIILGKALVITRKIVGPLANLIGVETVAGVGVATLIGIFVILYSVFLQGSW